MLQCRHDETNVVPNYFCFGVAPKNLDLTLFSIITALTNLLKSFVCCV